MNEKIVFMSPVDDDASRRLAALHYATSRPGQWEYGGPVFKSVTHQDIYTIMELFIAAPPEIIQYQTFPHHIYPVKIPKLELQVVVSPQEYACENRSRYEQGCPICTETMTFGQDVSQILPCGHIFCKDCVETPWIDGASRCPVCRTGVVNLANVKVIKE